MVIVPVVVAVGAGEPHGSAITSHEEPGPTLVQPRVAVVASTADVTNAVGLGQVGGGLHVILATHPALTPEPSDLKLKVKQPSTLDEVNVSGSVGVPQKAPGKVIGPLPAPFVLAICGAEVELPS